MIKAHKHESHLAAVLQALLVTFLWSTSWVLIKIGLVELPPITFAALRYALACLILLPLVLGQATRRRALADLDRSAWLRLLSLGLVMIAFTQGAQFLALSLASAVTVGLMLSLTPLTVAVMSVPVLGERPTRLQCLGGGILLFGALLFFGAEALAGSELAGIAVGGLGMLANSAAALQGREINRQGSIPPSVVTLVSMGMGSAVLLGIGLAVEGWPAVGPRSWLLLGWLAGINTAFAFTLWNHTLRRLSATESSVINNTMLIQIAVLAWIFLDESLSGRQIAGVLVAAVGALVVQLRRLPPRATALSPGRLR